MTFDALSKLEEYEDVARTFGIKSVILKEGASKKTVELQYGEFGIAFVNVTRIDATKLSQFMRRHSE